MQHAKTIHIYKKNQQAHKRFRRLIRDADASLSKTLDPSFGYILFLCVAWHHRGFCVVLPLVCVCVCEKHACRCHTCMISLIMQMRGGATSGFLRSVSVLSPHSAASVPVGTCPSSYSTPFPARPIRQFLVLCYFFSSIPYSKEPIRHACKN